MPGGGGLEENTPPFASPPSSKFPRGLKNGNVFGKDAGKYFPLFIICLFIRFSASFSFPGKGIMFIKPSKQRAYLHIRRPRISKKWDRSYEGKNGGGTKKSKKKKK